MNLAYFRFYKELNDFLPLEKREILFPYTFRGNPSVKDAIEAMRVPHVEVDLILVNSLSVDFSYKLKDADTVSVYPVFESFDIASVTHLREKPLRALRFICDVHLGKLTKLLRLCGFDTRFDKTLCDKEIIEISMSDKRIILTRDIGLLKNKNVTHGYWIRSQNPYEQLKDLFIRLQLKGQVNFLSRCSVCNGVLIDIAKEEILTRLLPNTRQYYVEFKKCNHCDHIYWKGSHYINLKREIDALIKDT